MTTTTTVPTPAVPRLAVARHRLVDDVGGLAAVAGLAFVVVTAVTVAASLLPGVDRVTISGWDIVTQPARWFAGALGVYLTAVYLPLYVAHGITRREVLRQAPLAAIPTAAAFAALLTLGYALEGLVYRLAGWEQGLTIDHLYDRPDAWAAIAAQSLLIALAFLAGGALAGAAFYRSGGLGLAVVPLLLAMVGVMETVARGDDGLPWVRDLVAAVGLQVGSWTAATVLTAACVTIGVVGTWLVARDLPLRPPPR